MGTGIAIVANRVGAFPVKIIDTSEVKFSKRIDWVIPENSQRSGLTKKFKKKELQKTKNMIY